MSAAAERNEWIDRRMGGWMEGPIIELDQPAAAYADLPAYLPTIRAFWLMLQQTLTNFISDFCTNLSFLLCFNNTSSSFEKALCANLPPLFFLLCVVIIRFLAHFS